MHSLERAGQAIPQCSGYTALPSFPNDSPWGKCHWVADSVRMSHRQVEHQLKRSVSFTVKYFNHPWKINDSHFCLLNKVKANLLRSQLEFIFSEPKS